VRIAVYALARNEERHATAWAESCRDADLRIVTDTGSTDATVQLLRDAGVDVRTGCVSPWRWDDAHNLSLNAVPAEVDVCIRLDLDERLQPGWRPALEAAWSDGVNQLRYHYVWSWNADGSEGVTFHCDRVHSRHGFRWSQATHEGLCSWAGEKKVAFCDGLAIHHHRDAGKKHTTDLELLRVAVSEAPHDARALWYLAREMDYVSDPETATTFLRYLTMDGQTPTETAYAERVLYRLTGDEQHLHNAAKAAPGEPDAWQQLAFANYLRQHWRNVEGFARQALASRWPPTHATDPHAKTKATDLLAVALWNLGNRAEALTHARAAAAKWPDDERLARNVAAMEHELTQEAAA
jgi:hypothetical protein